MKEPFRLELRQPRESTVSLGYCATEGAKRPLGEDKTMLAIVRRWFASVGAPTKNCRYCGKPSLPNYMMCEDCNADNKAA